MTNPNATHECVHCNKKFVRERTLINHMCEKKRRWMNRDEKYVRIGYEAWKTFYIKSGLAKSNAGNDLSYKKFMNTEFYLEFTKFGRHVMGTKMVNPMQFIDFVIQKNIRLDDWCKKCSV